MSDIKNCAVQIPCIDLELLKKQKTALISIPAEILSEQQYEALDGIINLLDAIQDYGVDVLGFSAEKVFNLT